MRWDADLEAVRACWAALANERLREHGIDARVDHRSLAAQGIEREATRHLGPAATGYERRTGAPSWKRLQFEREAFERLARAKEAGELERQAQRLDRSILDLSGDLAAAKAERDRQVVALGKAAFRAQFEQAKRMAIGRQLLLEDLERFRAEQQAQCQAELARQEAEPWERSRAQETSRKQVSQPTERETPKQQRNGPHRSR